MNKFLHMDESNLIIKYDDIYRYSSFIKLTINDNVIVEREIDKDYICDCTKLKNGDNIKLYINKDNSWFYVENIYVNFVHKVCLNKKNILLFIDEFEKNVGDLKNGKEI